MVRGAAIVMFLTIPVACGRLGFDGSGRDAGGPGSGSDDGFPIDAPPAVCTFPTLTCEIGSLGSTLGKVASGSTAGMSNGFSSCNGGGPDVAYQWVAPTEGRYEVDTYTSSYDTVLSVFSSCGGTLLGCNDDDPIGGTRSSLSLDLAACQPVTIAVDGTTGAGNYVLDVVRKCPGTFLGSALGSAIAMGSSLNAGDSYSTGCGGLQMPDVTMQWVAPHTGRYMFVTYGSSYDTILSILTSCSGGEIACNDDDPVGGTRAALPADLAGGQRVHVVIDSGAGNGGNYTLGVIDKCPGAELGSATGSAVAIGTTFNQGDAYRSTCGSVAEPEATFHWTAPHAGSYTFDTLGSSIDTVLAVYSDCSGTQLGCNDDDPAGGTHSKLTLSLAAGQETLITVDTGAGQGGNFVLNIGP